MHRLRTFVLSSLALVAAPSLATAAAVPIPKHLYLQSVRYAIEQMDGTGVSADYFVIADKERFLAAVDGWLEGVVEDPEYLRHVDTAPWAKSFLWSQSLDMEGLTQPKGWTGTAQGIATPQEWKYDGYVILANFQPQQPVTPFHEAIHAYAFAIGGGEIDADVHGGPEFISAGFRNVVRGLRTRDDTVKAIAKQLAAGQDARAEIDRFWQGIDSLQRTYEGQTEAPQVEQLLHAMGGKADWAGYRARVQETFDEARDGGRTAGMSPECQGLSRKLEAVAGKVIPLSRRIQTSPPEEAAEAAAQLAPYAQEQARLSARFMEIGCIPPDAMGQIEGQTGMTQAEMIRAMRGGR